MVNNNYTREMAIEEISSGYPDLVAFGSPFIANTDLVIRVKKRVTLNKIDGGSSKVYTDYSML